MISKVEKADAVSSGKLEVSWHQIDWYKANQHVSRVQLRIAKAVSLLLPPANHKGVLKGLSRMLGDWHVRFLGEGVSVMGPPYPTTVSIRFFALPARAIV